MPAVEERVEVYTSDDSGLWQGDYLITDKVSEEALAAAYMQFKVEGTLDKVFHEGVPSLSWFLNRFVTAPGTEILAAYKRQPDGTLDFGGLNWFNQRTTVGGLFDKAECGHAYFRKYHDLVSSMTWSRLGIEFTFRYLGVSSLYGATPEPNRAALACARRIGFELFGPIPGFSVYEGRPCSVFITSMTKERWNMLQEKQYGRL